MLNPICPEFGNTSQAGQNWVMTRSITFIAIVLTIGFAFLNSRYAKSESKMFLQEKISGIASLHDHIENNNRLQKLFKQVFVLMISSLTIFMTFQLGSDLGMQKTIHARHTFYSIPAAIGILNHGGTGYTVYSQIYELMTSSQTDLNSLINQSIQLKNLDRSEILFVPSDDKGTIDFVVGSFILFGPKVESLYFGYFFILIASALIYFLQFRNNDSQLIFLPIFLLSLYSMTRVLPITQELFSFHNPRVFGSLAVIPVMHLCFLMIKKQQPTKANIIGVLVQVIIIVEVIHVRSTEIWVFFTLLLIATNLLFKKIKNAYALWPLILLTIGLLTLNFYQRATYSPEYFETKGQYHVVWHNIGIGLSLHPRIADEYNLAVDDLPMVNLVKKQARILGGNKLVEDIFGQNTNVHGIASNLQLYESTARQLVFEIVKNHPKDILELQFWYKPKVFIKNVLWAAGIYPSNYEELKISGQIGSITAEQDRFVKGIFLVPINWYVLGCLTLLAITFSTLSLKLGAFLIVIQAITSLIPAFVTYPLIHTLAIPLIFVTMFIQMVALAILKKIFVALLK